MFLIIKVLVGLWSDQSTIEIFPVVQACALIFASTYVILNLIADLIGIISNPRLLYPK